MSWTPFNHQMRQGLSKRLPFTEDVQFGQFVLTNFDLQVTSTGSLVDKFACVALQENAYLLTKGVR